MARWDDSELLSADIRQLTADISAWRVHPATARFPRVSDTVCVACGERVGVRNARYRGADYVHRSCMEEQ